MRAIILAAILAMAACNHHADEYPMEPGSMSAEKIKLVQQILKKANERVAGPIEQVQYFKAGNRRFASIEYRPEGEGGLKNMLLEAPEEGGDIGSVYICRGTCSCYVAVTINPDGNYEMHCTCTNCAMIVFRPQEAGAFFE